MIAVDTNLLVRILTRDDPDQARAALARMKTADRVWIGKTVLLETEWVLRHSYKISREVINEAFRDLVGGRSVEMEDRPAVIRALRGHAQGLDFADALHLASSRGVATFVTFDRTLASAAEQIAGGPKVALLKPR